MRYPDQIVDDVQSANDIVEVISQYIPLKRAGRNFKALCPFHQEKSPSFMVHPEKQIFHCFGCGAGGDVFSFLMRYENMSFPEAIRVLADKVHIRLPELTAEKADEDKGIEQLYEAYRLAAEFYHSQFLHPEEGKKAREYFLSRGFDMDTAAEFKIGWASSEWQGLLHFLGKKGFKEIFLLKSGLISQSQKGRTFDLFRGRLLFPIQNLQGKVIGFGGRVISKDDAPKYLNSPENPIFRKRRELFGLSLAKKHIDREKPRIIVVEGYLDFLRLYVAGFKTTVATLGTALTNEHVQVLRRFADEAVVIYDGDKAGESASLRGLEVFLEEGMTVKLVRMPSGFDPDDFVRKQGAPAFQKLLDSAQDFFDYKFDALLQKYNPEDSLGLMKITEDILDTLMKVKSQILLSHYLRRLGNALRLDENALRTELGKRSKKAGKQTYETQGDTESKTQASMPQREEILLLGLMMDDRSIWETACQELSEADFSEVTARELFHKISRWEPKSNANMQVKIFSLIRDEKLKSQLAAVSTFEWDEGTRRKAFEDCLRKIKKRQLEQRINELRRDIAKAEREGNQNQVGTYIKEYQTLLQQIKT